MLPTRRPTDVVPRLGAGVALLSGPAVAELEATALVAPALTTAVAVAVVEVLALMGVLTWTLALAALVAVLCVRATVGARRRRRASGEHRLSGP